MPLYSIIIPTFNSEESLKDCMESVLNQNFKDFELIISDGASVDRTIQIADSFADSRIKILSEPDKGTYDAMNKALAHATGDWIYFLGSDDLLLNPDVLKDVHDRLSRTSADVIYGSVKIAGDSNWAKDGDIYRGETPAAVLFECNISHQSVFYAKKIFSQFIYDLNYKVCADHDLNLYCAANYKMEHIPVVIALFKSGGASSVNPDQNFERDKWMNIVCYFQKRLLDTSFPNSRNGVKKAWKRFLIKGEFKMAALSVRIYIYHSYRRLF